LNGEKLKKLIEHRDAILLAEIGALIHDLGKLSEEFISVKSPENSLNVKNDKHAEWIFDWHPQLNTLLNVGVTQLMVVLWGWLCPWWCQALLFCLGLVKTGVLGVQLSAQAPTRPTA